MIDYTGLTSTTYNSISMGELLAFTVNKSASASARGWGNPAKISRLFLSSIDPSEPYLVIDSHTGQVVGNYKYKERGRARAKAERMNQEYGAVRFICSLGESNE